MPHLPFCDGVADKTCKYTRKPVQVRVDATLGTFSSDDDDAGENVRKTIVLISKILAVHVRYNLWYISLPSSAKQRHKMTIIKVFWRTLTPDD